MNILRSFLALCLVSFGTLVGQSICVVEQRFSLTSVQDGSGRWYDNSVDVGFVIQPGDGVEITRVRVSVRLGGRNIKSVPLGYGTRYEATLTNRTQYVAGKAPDGPRHNSGGKVTVFYLKDGRRRSMTFDLLKGGCR